eukprot:gene16673-16853_t
MRKNPYYSGPKSDHFDGSRFFIPHHPFAKGLGELLKWRFGRAEKGAGKAKWPKQTAPVFSDTPPERVAGGQLRVSYIGHASFLIQTQGLNILIDPVWSERASPLSFLGPKRVNPPGIALGALPPIDVILITHNHYDHLDLAVLSKLHQSFAPRILTPLGNDAILKRANSGFNVEAYDWDARVPLSADMAVHFEPSYHWSARGVNDRSMALWCAFVLETSAGSIYHIGDTGFRDGAIFDAVRQKHGPMRLAILPIGAYEPRWFMRDQHINPEEAVRIFRSIDAQTAIAHHWGAFQLTDEAIHAPLEALQAAILHQEVEAGQFHTPRPGQFVTVA